MSGSEIKVACKRCLKPGDPVFVDPSPGGRVDTRERESGELCQCGGEFVTIANMLVLMKDRITMLATHIADQALKMSELEDRELDVVFQEIGHQVGARDGQHVLDGVRFFVEKSKALAEYALKLANAPIDDPRDVVGMSRYAEEVLELLPED